MKKITAIVIVFVAVLMMVTPVFAGGDAGHGGPGLGFLYAVINFVILVGFLFWALKTPMRQFFGTRSLSTKQTIEETKSLHNQAFRKFEEIECKLKNADVEGKELIATVKKQAEQEKQYVIEHAKEVAAKIKADTERMANQEVLKAKMELKAEAIELAAQLATQKIKTAINDDDQKRLSDDFVGRLRKVEVS